MMLWNLAYTKEDRKNIKYDNSFPGYFNHFYSYGTLCTETFAKPSNHQETDMKYYAVYSRFDLTFKQNELYNLCVKKS